jgi:multidrug efflux pump subunit AcrA (membrane-fusion protein)
MLALVAAVAFGLGAAAVWRVRSAAPGPPDAVVGSARSAVVALGRLRPARLLTVVGPPGDQIAEVLVKNGDVLAAGAELVRLASQADRLADVNLLRQQVESGKASASWRSPTPTARCSSPKPNSRN